MNGFWALCIVLAAPIDDTTSPPPPEPISHIIPESLTRLMTQRPEFNAHHLGYLRELAKLPDLAKSETAWWQVSSAPALRNLAARFEDVLARNKTAQYRFNVFYEALLKSPDLRRKVENLVRVELDNAQRRPELATALQFLRANPDIALRYLKDPATVRPLPEALEDTNAYFEQHEEWRSSLFKAYDEVAQTPDAHLLVFPWWRELAMLTAPTEGENANLDAALYRRPAEYWLWHLRNLNLASDAQAGPWIRYWQRLIQREPDLAREYGPFITKLFEDPERLREHLINLTTQQDESPSPWPPSASPPDLPPLVIDDPVERMKQGIKRPSIAYPDRPEVERPGRPDGPKRPTRPASPNRPTIAP